MDAIDVPSDTAGPCGRLQVGHEHFVRQVLDRVGDKWTLLVIATLGDGPLRYSDLRQSVPGISQRMLTLTLRQVRQDGLVTRTSYPQVPPRVEYALTALGKSLVDTSAALVRWATDHHHEIRDNRARSDSETGSAEA